MTVPLILITLTILGSFLLFGTMGAGIACFVLILLFAAANT